MAGWRSGLLVAVLACGGGPPGEDASGGRPSDDPLLVLGDLQHLLGEAVAAHAAGDPSVAERSWTGAVGLWRHQIGPRVRAHDPMKALELEYALGRLGGALGRPGGKPGVAQKALDRELQDVRPWLTEVSPGLRSEAPGSP